MQGIAYQMGVHYFLGASTYRVRFLLVTLSRSPTAGWYFSCIFLVEFDLIVMGTLTKSPCPQVISLEWGLVSGRRLFYLLVDQSKDKV
jgi:hypothetical protein